MNFLIKNATILLATSKYHGKKQDILIEKGIISKIGKNIAAPPKIKVLEGKEIYATIGLCDIGVHSGEPGYEHRETIQQLCAAAIKGGYTRLAVFPNTKPIIQTKGDISYLQNHDQKQNVTIDVIGALSKDTKGLDINEYLDMYHAGVKGFGDGMKGITDNGLMTRALTYAKQCSAKIIHHPHDPSLASDGQIHEGKMSTSLGVKGVPSIAEYHMVQRDILLLEYTGGSIVEHAISADSSVQAIKAAQKQGLNMDATVAYMNLLHTDAELVDFDSNLKVSPVLRSSNDRKALRKGIETGVIKAIVSNHTPLDEEAKNVEFTYAEPGTIGLETCLIACVDGLKNEMDIAEVIHAMTVGPREILGIQIPKIEEGVKAELCIFDTKGKTYITKENLSSISKNSPYIGKTFETKVLATIV